MEGTGVTLAGLVDIDTGLDEELDGFQLAAEDGKEESVHSVGVFIFQVGAEGEQSLHHFDIAGLGGAEEGGESADAEEAGATAGIGSAGLEISTAGDEFFGEGDLALRDRFVEWSASIRVFGVDVYAVVEHDQSGLFVAAAEGNQEG